MLSTVLVGGKNFITVITEQGYSMPVPHLQIGYGTRNFLMRGLIPPIFNQLSPEETVSTVVPKLLPFQRNQRSVFF